jgi:hypothetical protein
MRILRTHRADLFAGIRRPDDLIRGLFDLFAFEKVFTLFVACEIDDVLVLSLSMHAQYEKSTAFPSRRQRAEPVSFSGISVGEPVGPITRTSSPSFNNEQSRDDVPISRTIIDSRPFSSSTHAPVRARPSIKSREPSMTGG